MYIRIFEQLLYLGVVLGFDLLVVDKILLLAFVVVELEPVLVQRVLQLVTADVVDGNRQRHCRPVVGLWLADVGRSWRRSILVFFQEIKSGLYMMWCVCSRKDGRFLSLRLMDSWELNSC
jgi:hypothetical protein